MKSSSDSGSAKPAGIVEFGACASSFTSALATVVTALNQAGAASVMTCVLLDKPARRVAKGLPHADLVGFTIPDHFVVGYGLDHDGRWRQLPDVCVLGG